MSPQADYVVANGTGAAVRSDINGQLAAIVSNNSGATEPATMYAYQWWPDTTTGLLKLRNAANNAWITVGTLASANLGLAALASPTFTGTVTAPTFTASTAVNIPLGSAGSPTLFFTGDTNNGLFSPGADIVALTTDGSERFRIAASGQIGLGGANYGTSGQALTSNGSGSAPTWQTPVSASDKISEGNTEAEVVDTGSDGHFKVTTEGSERLRVDPSGRLLVGTSTATANGGVLELSGGITFPATAVAASNANTLDDYEEGTWTPNIDNGYNSGNTVTYTAQGGSYTKIGRLVVAAFHIQIATWSGNAGPVFFAGLPFTPATTTDARFQCAAYLSGPNTPASTVSVNLGYGRADNGSYYLVFNCVRDDTAMANAGMLVGGDFAANDIVAGTFTFFV
jgi:hypothetical protein